ncbi:MAG: hypothetical protein FWG44_02750 [Oscillospiraceae bacterium]|nr:hypothetical protein [Oscillospiraceae bacterium]
MGTRLLIFIFAIITILTFSGCAFETVEDMLSPPRLTDEQSAIYKALTDNKGTGFKLKYPKSGEHRSAFAVYGEKQDSAVVFYEISIMNTERSLWMNFLFKNADGQWESLHDMPVIGTDIESISFERFGKEEEDFILLSYNIGHNEKRCMIIGNIYEKPAEQHGDVFSFMQVDYFFGREYKELLMIKNDRSTQAIAVFYNYSNGQLVISAQCELDPSAGEYTGITQGYVTKRSEAVFINHRKQEVGESYGTDVLYYHGRDLINPIVQNPDNLDKTLRRVSNVTELANPRDIDGDGLIDLCYSGAEFPGNDSLPNAEKLRPVIWRKFEGFSLIDKYYSYFSEKYDFVFFLPRRWIGDITAAVDFENDIVKFYSENETTLLQIKIIPQEFDEEELLDFADSDNWVFYKKGAENNLLYYIKSAESENTLALTAEELEYAFRILSEIKYEPLEEE